VNDTNHIEPDCEAAGIEARAAEWLQRRQFWNWSEADEAALNAWLEEAMAHRIAYWRLNAGFSRTDRLAALRHPAQEAPARTSFPFAMKIAASLALIAALGAAGAQFLMPPRDRDYSTAVGGHETVSFADGSRIELNTNTSLRTRMTTKERIVWLERGEAFFQVRHDPAHPFIVYAGNHRVTDLGTKFTVRRDSGRLEVAVVQGRVRFDGAAQKKPALLTPGDVAVATANSLSVTRESTKDLTNNLGWRSGLLVFRHATLAQAAAEFNRYNRVKLVVPDPQTAALKIYGVFRTGSIEDFTHLAEMVLGLHVSHNGNELVITR
jgi:transmembrane sensor